MIESEIDRGILVSRVEGECFLNRLDWYLINTQAFFVQVGRMTFFLWAASDCPIFSGMMGFCDLRRDGLAPELAGGRDQLFRDPTQVVASDIKEMGPSVAA